LDFFVYFYDEYSDQVKEVFTKLKEDGFFWDPNNDFLSRKTFTTCKVGWNKSDALLKLDFVNDVSSHFGEIIKTDLFFRTDSIRNILSNKITCLFRFAAKDVADLREIALRTQINWPQVIHDARNKEAGIEIPILCDILRGIPQSEFETIAWVNKPEWEEFRSDIERIVFDMMNGGITTS
jgi:hypothetical protein